jgi:uncharacterized membrane protein
MNGEAGKQGHPIAALTYIGFFITGIVFLYLEPYNQDDYVRFHARQSIGFSVAWFALEVVLGVFISILPGALRGLLVAVQTLLNLAIAVFWVFLMYKAYVGERYRIPELADIIDNVAGSSASH